MSARLSARWEIVTEQIPRRSHYWWCHECGEVGEREERLSFAADAYRVHRAWRHA